MKAGETRKGMEVELDSGFTVECLSDTKVQSFLTCEMHIRVLEDPREHVSIVGNVYKLRYPAQTPVGVTSWIMEDS